MVSWVLTAGGGFVLLSIWLAQGGMAQPAGGGNRIRPPLILSHFLLAAGGLVVWIVYLAADRDWLDARVETLHVARTGGRRALGQASLVGVASLTPGYASNVLVADNQAALAGLLIASIVVPLVVLAAVGEVTPSSRRRSICRPPWSA